MRASGRRGLNEMLFGVGSALPGVHTSPHSIIYRSRSHVLSCVSNGAPGAEAPPPRLLSGALWWAGPRRAGSPRGLRERSPSGTGGLPPPPSRAATSALFAPGTLTAAQRAGRAG